MDDIRHHDGDVRVAEDDLPDAPPAIGTDERRMHVRAYNYWVSLLAGRPFPAVADIEPQSLGDFGPHGVLLDFSADPLNPSIAFLGSLLADECALDRDIRTISEVPPRSLLSRLTDHHLQIIANRAPIGFEAEFVSQRGHNTLYRGILMPFSSDRKTIDFVYGVINWKELADAGTTAELMLAIDRELRPLPSAPAAPLWADGPGASTAGEDAATAGVEDLDFSDVLEGLADHLAAARDGAYVLRQTDGRGRSALYRALGLAYDFALVAEARPDEFAEMLADAGLKQQARAPMTPIAKLVFGADYDKSRLTEFAAVLSHARRTDTEPGTLAAILDRQEGGMKALVAAERRARRPAPRREFVDRAFDAMRHAPAHAEIALDSGDAEFVLLVARRVAPGTLAIVAPVPQDQPLLERAVRRVVR